MCIHVFFLLKVHTFPFISEDNLILFSVELNYNVVGIMLKLHSGTGHGGGTQGQCTMGNQTWPLHRQHHPGPSCRRGGGRL